MVTKAERKWLKEKAKKTPIGSITSWEPTARNREEAIRLAKRNFKREYPNLVIIRVNAKKVKGFGGDYDVYETQIFYRRPLDRKFWKL